MYFDDPTPVQEEPSADAASDLQIKLLHSTDRRWFRRKNTIFLSYSILGMSIQYSVLGVESQIRNKNENAT